MKKFALAFLMVIFAVSYLSAQKGDLIVKSSDKGLYLEHKVVSKESYYSVGRHYNVHPKFLASFNKLELTKGLLIDQKLKIPLTDTNFTQQGNAGAPVYYKVGDNEDLEKISNNNKNVSPKYLRQWNDLSGEKVKEGTKLIIGFLLSKEIPSVTITNKQAKEETIIKTEEKPLITEQVVVEKKSEEKKT